MENETDVTVEKEQKTGAKDTASDADKKPVSSQEADDSRVYEVGYHVVPTLEEEEAAKVAAEVRASIEKEGGTFVSEEIPKRMTLAYEITVSDGGKKQRYTESYFGWIKFDAPPEAAPPIKFTLSSNRKLIRFCLIQTVREDTRAPKHIADERAQRAPRVPLEPLAIERRTPVTPEEKPKQTLTDEEIDKTIEELIAN